MASQACQGGSFTDGLVLHPFSLPGVKELPLWLRRNEVSTVKQDSASQRERRVAGGDVQPMESTWVEHLGSNPSWGPCLLCDLGRGTEPPWASVSISVTWSDHTHFTRLLQ